MKDPGAGTLDTAYLVLTSVYIWGGGGDQVY